MDRRQRKSRDAIFKAFTDLLANQNIQHITVGQIIERADVGRATFYAHFETKEYLLKELSEELFCHLFDAMAGEQEHHHIFDCDAAGSPFEHLFRHLQSNDNQLLRLLSGENRELFLPYFSDDLKSLVRANMDQFPKADALPADYWEDFIVSAFVQTMRWWAEHGKEQSPEEITAYFMRAVTK